MKAVVCRVDRASVVVDGRTVGQVGRGLLIFAGVVDGDDESDVKWMAKKLASLRLFNDQDDKMNLSVKDVAGGILLIPNFTLAGRTSKGTRPSYSNAAPPDVASKLFHELFEALNTEVPTEKGVFQAHMAINSDCNGPVTVIVESPAK